MSGCFEKHVGKRKKTEDENNLDLDAAAARADKIVIIDDSSGNGRTDRRIKRRKRDEENEDRFEIAKNVLQNEFAIEVDDSMSKKAVIELAEVMCKSKNDEGITKKCLAQSGEQKSKLAAADDKESSEDDIVINEQSKEVKGRNETKKHTKQEQSSDDERWYSTDYQHVTSRGKLGKRKPSHTSGKDNSEIDEVDILSDSREVEESLTVKHKKGKDRNGRKRVLESSVEHTTSSQESKDVSVHPKKSRNLQLNKKQIESMQAKTSSLLKKSAANVRLCQENQQLPLKQASESHVLKMADEETQEPGSQELFGEDPVQQDMEPVSAEESDHTARSLKTIPAYKFMDVIWPKHIPMKRTQYPKVVSLRRSKQNAGPHTFYAPPNSDPFSYYKVIIQLFNIYFEKLSKEQAKMPLLAWNEPVKPGRHMSRTVDVKARGQNSYPWSSDSNEGSSDEEKKDTHNISTLKGTATGQRATRLRRLSRHNSNESNKESEGDFIPEPNQIQPRQTVVTSRKALPGHYTVQEDEDSLPDPGISSSDNQPEAGQSCFAGDTQPMSPSFPSSVPQTLGMDEDLYMADTETLGQDVTEVQSDESDHPIEIQPRKSIHWSPLAEKNNMVDHSNNKRKGSNKFGKVKSESVSPKPSQSSPASILNSQGEINSFQKVKPGTFNLDLDEEDSSNLDIELLETKSSKTKIFQNPDSGNSSVEDSVHDSPVISARKSKTMFTKAKATNPHIMDSVIEDDIFEDKRKGKVLSAVSRSSYLADEQKPSTSKKFRVIPIDHSATCERKPRATASVKPYGRLRFKDDADEVTKSRQAEKEIECPMCSKMFGADKIAVHASDCLGQEVTSTTGDDEVTGIGSGEPHPGTSGHSPNQRKGDHSTPNKFVRGDGTQGHPQPQTGRPVAQYR